MRSPAGWAVVLAAAFLSGCATAHNYLEPDQPLYQGSFAPPAVDRPGPDTIRVVTYNIEVGAHVAEATEVLRDRSELRAADVVLLQEMDEPGVRAIAEALSLGYVYVPSSRHTKQDRDIGNAILSPWPIEERWKVRLPHLARVSGHARSAVGARLRIGGRSLRVYSLHLATLIGLGKGQRRDQLEAVIAHASASTDPVVIAGDFNGKDMARHLARRGFVWPTRGIGRTSTLLRFSFDHVLVRGLAPAADPGRGVVRDVPKGISDHFPVWTSLRFE
ncbi:MAG: endonuclease/exonuclease/phosphatase family protein [Vicinamibacteria bacterium]